MSDIVERLTETATLLPTVGFVSVGQEAAEAAATITELRKEVERLREALSLIAVVGFSDDPKVSAAIARQTVMQARTALQGETSAD